MPETNISSAVVTTNTQEDFSVDPQETDGVADQPETVYDNTFWSIQLGYYTNIPELTSVIDAKATWTIGKGIETDPETQFILDTIKGWGVDTFNTILENCIRTYHIGGDSFCEIIRDDDDNLINLKPLDPGVMRIVVNRKGLIKRYEQRSKIKGEVKKFQPEEIFHLAKNRVADNIHGTGIIDRLVDIILMKNEAMADFKRVMHRNVDPLFIVHADTDDPFKIEKIKSDWESVRKTSDTWVVPKDVVVPELVAVAPNASLNPLSWIESLDNKFYEAAQVPKIIVGGAGGITEAAVKIAYLAWEQTIEEEQLYIEEQVGMQLGLEIDLVFPASLENELLSDKQKDGAQNIDPSETTAGEGQ